MSSLRALALLAGSAALRRAPSLHFASFLFTKTEKGQFGRVGVAKRGRKTLWKTAKWGRSSPSKTTSCAAPPRGCFGCSHGGSSKDRAGSVPLAAFSALRVCLGQVVRWPLRTDGGFCVALSSLLVRLLLLRSGVEPNPGPLDSNELSQVVAAVMQPGASPARQLQVASSAVAPPDASSTTAPTSQPAVSQTSPQPVPTGAPIAAGTPTVTVGRTYTSVATSGAAGTRRTPFRPGQRPREAPPVPAPSNKGQGGPPSQ